jgi:isopenicillin N synthase-like dioxygenase
LRRAAHDVGFFYVVGHGIPESVTDGLFHTSRACFAQPVEDRLSISNLNSPHFRGYTRVGTEYTASAPDQRDQIDFGPERQPLTLGADDPAYLRLVGPNEWPAQIPDLKRAVLTWIDEAGRVARQVLRALAESLGQPSSYFDQWFDDEAGVSTKLIRYPGVEALGADAAAGQGVGSHKDYGYLALVLQGEHSSLQVATDDGRWIDAQPRRGSLVVNIGEALEIATLGYLKATRHRVVSPPAGVERFSAAFFLGPRLDAVVEPLELPADLAAQAAGVDTDPGNPLFAEYGRKSLLGRLRSHPAVARRWHPDLLGVVHHEQSV